ncbi:MAG TPA: transposase [Pyrinomonadaceae bacterium]|nr:transposase [Pyrinomonadaceae bacterium]
MFRRIDATLDSAGTGHLWLAQPEIASMVQATLVTRYASLYKLWAYVVMANHVHLLITPKMTLADHFVPLSKILQKLKGYTAREANLMLGRTGMPFWQDESFDHWSRDHDEFMRIVTYIENNPVKAGLVMQSTDWKYSSAAERKRRGLTTVCSLT